MGGFHLDPEAGITCESWFTMYEDIFQVEFSHHDDFSKVRILLRKHEAAEHEN